MNLTAEDYLSIYSNMLSICRNREDCHFGDHKTLRELNRETGTKVGQGMVSTYLELLNAATNYKVKLSRLQIKMLSQTIYDKFFYLKETELMLFFSDYYKYVNSDEFFGSIEPKTITTMLTKWVQVTRGRAIEQHDKLLSQQREEEEKPFLMTWEEYNSQTENSSSANPLDRFFSVFGKKKASKDTKESIIESAKALISNKWGYDDDSMTTARCSFVRRYGYSPEDYLRKEGKYV